MKLKNHVISSGIVGSTVYLITGSPAGAIASVAAGILIDTDHIIDYYLNFGFSLNLRKIYLVINSYKLNKIYIFLHSFELLAAFWLVTFLIPLSMVYFAIGVGLTLHILLDQICNPVMPRAYFLTYRIAHGFKKDCVLNLNKLSLFKE
ncbi:MAG: hypothetical protein NTV07_04305 [Candidatus Omnitrophica bacterium]|nr:hypothetical protein [Candidatus Omnitrophota bacterium]